MRGDLTLSHARCLIPHMRETHTPEISTLAADEALSYVREVETLDAEIDALYEADGDDPRVRRARARSHHRLGIALKLAGVHAHLAVAEQVTGLRADLAGADVWALAESCGVVTEFIPGERHHCGEHCPEDCDLNGAL